MKTIQWNDINLKGKNSGQIKTVCPACSPDRRNKADRCLSVNINEGVAKCHHCEGISIRDEKSLVQDKVYKLPEQNWVNYTKLSDGMVKWCESRKIRQSTLKELGVTEEEYFQPQAGKKMNNIVFNYFEGDTLVNKKFRSGGKHFTQTAQTKPIFYNINSAIGQDEVFIVEGEFDVLAMHQCGFKNTISIPNGANDNDDFWINCEKYLKDVSKFYIATDNDDKGEVVADKIAQRLGRYRCVRVLFKNKDANGDLVDGGDDLVKESIVNGKRYPASGTFTIEDLAGGIHDLYDNGLPETLFPKHKCFGNLKNVFTVMRGHLVVSTGIPSHGKSNFTEWYVLNLIRDYNLKASFFSPEHNPMALHQTTFIEKFFGRNFWQDNPNRPKVSKDEINRYIEWANEKIYITAPERGEMPTWGWIMEKFKEQMFIYGVDMFVIDAFNKIDFDKSSDSELSKIKRVLTHLTMFAQMNNVIIFLVVHPTKMRKNDAGVYDMPTLYDCSGSADFRNQTHDGFTIYRHFEEIPSSKIDENDVEFVTQKVKMKFQGEMNASEFFRFDVVSGRYYAKHQNPPNFVFDKEEGDLPMTSLSEAFGVDNDDLPF
jgi:twinkle protein